MRRAPSSSHELLSCMLAQHVCKAAEKRRGLLLCLWKPKILYPSAKDSIPPSVFRNLGMSRQGDRPLGSVGLRLRLALFLPTTEGVDAVHDL